jgi:hypothetical protein
VGREHNVGATTGDFKAGRRLFVLRMIPGTHCARVPGLNRRTPIGDRDRICRLDQNEHGATSSTGSVVYCPYYGNHDTPGGFQLSIDDKHGLHCRSIDGSHDGNGHKTFADPERCGPVLDACQCPDCVHLAVRWQEVKPKQQLETMK